VKLELAVQEDQISTLQSLGFTKNQAKIFLNLVRSGTCSAKTISKLSKVPREKVYRIMSQLHEKGLVIKTLSRPSKFTAVPIEDCIKILIKKKNKEHKELLEKTNDLLQKTNATNSSGLPEEESNFVLIPVREYNAKIRRKKVEDLQESLDCITTWKRFNQMVSLAKKSMSIALQKGVKCRYIMNKTKDEELPTDALKKLDMYPHFQIKYLPSAPKACLALFDKKEVYLITHLEKNLLDSPMLWSNNRCLASVIQDYFEIMWITAMESIPKQIY